MFPQKRGAKLGCLLLVPPAILGLAICLHPAADTAVRHRPKAGGRREWQAPAAIAVRAADARTAAAAGIRREGLSTRVYIVCPGDTFWGIARRLGVSLRALLAANRRYDPLALPVGARLIVPPGASSRAAARQRLSWPLMGRISSRYGWRWGRLHQGLDIAAAAGSIVRAAAAGRVVYAGWRSGYGLVVILAHADGLRTLYAHNSALLVGPDDLVAAGQALARVGATGNATGNHLHFEVIRDGVNLDPLGVLP